MKKINYIMMLLSILLMALCFASIIAMKEWGIQPFDTLAGNKIVGEVTKNWQDADALSDMDFKYEFAVVDNAGVVRYRTSKAAALSVAEALKNNDTIMDVTIRNKTEGKVLISSSYHQSLKELQEGILVRLLLLFGIFFLLIITVVTVINHFFFKPFYKLEQFAGEVAGGNLEAPLQIERHNLFGAFTESFDLMREQLFLAKQREYEANLKKKELVASLSHDIKTPVTSIKLVSELLLAANADSSIRGKLQNIYDKADQIDGLVSDMFHSTLEDLGELKVNNTEEFSTVLESMIQTADYKHLSQREAVPPCLILTDKIRLTQVINNIISNSYKYADTRITVSYQIADNFLLVNLEDYGPGVTEVELSHLFYKFYRGESAQVRNQGGAGLGLYIAKQLMKQMEGDIVCSNTQEGFLVQLAVKIV